MYAVEDYKLGNCEIVYISRERDPHALPPLGVFTFPGYYFI